MNRQRYIMLITKPRSNKLFCKFLYHRSVDSAWPYRLFFGMRTTSYCPPSLLKSVRSEMKTDSPLAIRAWAKSFVKSILWLCKTRIECKININLTVSHCTSVEYEFKGSGENISLSCNQVSSCTWKTMFLEAHCDQLFTFLKKSLVCPFS